MGILSDRPQGKWVQCFAEMFMKNGIGEGTLVALLAESESRPVNVELAQLALAQLGATAFLIQMPSPKIDQPIGIRSTGTTYALQGNKAVIAALKQVEVVVDCTVEGLLHSPEAPELLGGDMRWFMISNEHPEVFERLGTEADLERRVKLGSERFDRAKTMRVTSAAGTDLTVNLEGAPRGGDWGFTVEPGTRAHMPGGLIAAYPMRDTTNGTIVFSPGDANLTFKRYFDDPVTLTIKNDVVTEIIGDNLDAELLRSYFEAWDDPLAYTISHVGWGMSRNARWDSLVMYDKGDVNGTELRAFAGSFLISTGANEHAGRFTKCHFDFPMRNCTVLLDDEVIVEAGKLVGDLA